MLPAKQDQERFTIKCSLNGICVDENIKRQIENDVTEISWLMVDASVYIRHQLYSNAQNGDFPTTNNIEEYFKHLRVFENPNAYPLAAGYDEIRQQSGFHRKYVCKQNIFNFAWQKYQTAFRNNIVMHLEKHLNRFLKNVQTIMLQQSHHTAAQREQLYRARTHALAYLFGLNENYPVNDQLIWILLGFGWDGVPISDFRLSSKFYLYFELLYNIQAFNSEMGLKNFNLVPIFKHRRHHVHYDNVALMQLLGTVYRVKQNWPVFSQDLRGRWDEHFRVGHLETYHHRFALSIETDGAAASVSMFRTVPNITSSRKRRKVKPSMQEKYEQGQYHAQIGLDPGERRMYSGVGYFPGPPQDMYALKVKSNTFRGASGHFRRQRVRKKERNRIDFWYNPLASAVSPMSEDPEPYTRFRLLYFANKQTVYQSRKLAYLRLRKYIGTHKAATRLAKQFAVRGKNTLICVGNFRMASNSPIKGHVRTPKRLMISKMQIYADVLIVDEFRTSQLCSKCHSVLEKFKSPESYKFCKNFNCRTNWNRDINAGKNILQKGIAHITGQPLHHHYHRNFTPPRIQ